MALLRKRLLLKLAQNEYTERTKRQTENGIDEQKEEEEEEEWSEVKAKTKDETKSFSATSMETSLSFSIVWLAAVPCQEQHSSQSLVSRAQIYFPLFLRPSQIAH